MLNFLCHVVLNLSFSLAGRGSDTRARLHVEKQCGWLAVVTVFLGESVKKP